MGSSERDHVHLLSIPYLQSDDMISTSSTSQGFTISENEHNNLAGSTGRRNSFVQMSSTSGLLHDNHNHEFIFQPPPQNALMRQKTTNHRAGRNDRPMDAYNVEARQKHSRKLNITHGKFHNTSYRDIAKGWTKRICSRIPLPPVMYPHDKGVRRWNKFFVASCLFATILDPLFFFLLYVNQNNKCILLDRQMTTAFIVIRFMTDFVYCIHVLLQFRMAYVSSKPGIINAGELVDDPRKIVRNYVSGYFLIDFFLMLPLPQIASFILLKSVGASHGNYGRNFLQGVIISQFVPRLYRFIRLLAGSSPAGFIFKSVWMNFVIHLLAILLISHVVGSWWYFFGLQRVDDCFRAACQSSNITMCLEFIDCGDGNDYRKFMSANYKPSWNLWQTNENATACLQKDGFSFGVFQDSISLTIRKGLGTKYVYSFFWGFQQISTLAGNQTPSHNVLEILFTITIIGVGLVAFTLLIGNMQNYQVALGRRALDMALRQRDVKKWMKQHQFPKELRRKVRESERFNWTATTGINEEMLLENLPDDVQKEIRRHIIKFVKKGNIVFEQLDEPILDAIRERVRRETFVRGSTILFRGDPVDKMIYINRGKMESIGEDLIAVQLTEGDFCGEELLKWYLDHSNLLNKDGRRRRRIRPRRLLSSRFVRCITTVEAFVLQAADLEELTSLFAGSFRIPRVQGAIRNKTHYRQGLKVGGFRVGRKYRKK